jgi:hypothetical protein
MKHNLNHLVTNNIKSMITEDYKIVEKDALQFVQNVFGEVVADAFYLGTYKGISYFGPVFYKKDIVKGGLFITFCEDKFSLIPTDNFSLDSYEEMREFECRQHAWWDYTSIIQCAYNRGKRKALDATR